MADYVNDAARQAGDWLNALPPWARYGLVGAVTAVGAYYLKQRMSAVSKPITKEWKKGRVYLYQFTRSYYVPCISPYSMKLETWLRMANIDYENVDLPDLMSVRSKEGTLPFVELDGIEYPDSDLIIRDLTKIFHKDSMHAHLTPAEQGVCRAVAKLTENSALLSYGYVRYVHHMDELFNERVMPMDKFGTFAMIWFKAMLPFIKSQTMKNFKIMGIGKHSEEEIVNIGCADLKALSAILADKPYFLGDKPTATDACVFSLVGQILYLPIETPHKEYLLANAPNLVKHCERVKAEFWPDWDVVTKQVQTHSDAWKKKK